MLQNRNRDIHFLLSLIDKQLYVYCDTVLQKQGVLCLVLLNAGKWTDVYVGDYTLICTVCEAILYSSNIYCNQTAGNTKGRDWAVIKPRTPGG